MACASACVVVNTAIFREVMSTISQNGYELVQQFGFVLEDRPVRPSCQMPVDLQTVFLGMDAVIIRSVETLQPPSWSAIN